MSAERLHFVITGGTIDSVFDRTRDVITVASQSIIPEFIKSIRIEPEPEFSVVCLKDSRELTMEDQENIVSTVLGSESTRIVITHGTYTMPDTARLLKARLNDSGRRDQVIVFTGSMVPIRGFTDSDAPFNLGFAVAMTELRDPGLYVAMNAQTFDPDEVVKFLYEGRFRSIFTKAPLPRQQKAGDVMPK